MSSTGRRDRDEVLAGFVAWLHQRDPQRVPELIGHERPPVGYSTETLLVDIRFADRDEHIERLVLKLPPAGPAIFPTYDFVAQARVQEAVAAAGIPAPVPVQVEHDPGWLGRPFLVMPAIAGHIVDELPLQDHWLTRAEPELSAVVHRHYIDLVADVNRIDWRAAGLGDVLAWRDNSGEIDHWRRYLGWYAEGDQPVALLGEALDWCANHQPASEPPASLLWGDVRLGNVIFDEARTPVAVLDWEMASIGAAEHDLAWLLALEDIPRELLGRSVTGFFDHDAVVARYQARLGRPVQDLHWYEILALVRSTAILTRIAHLDELAGRPVLFPPADHPVVAVLARRLSEATP
jgi:aminoglycoside phosphotransferase (APT) family kinase protein